MEDFDKMYKRAIKQTDESDGNRTSRWPGAYEPKEKAWRVPGSNSMNTQGKSVPHSKKYGTGFMKSDKRD